MARQHNARGYSAAVVFADWVVRRGDGFNSPGQLGRRQCTLKPRAPQAISVPALAYLPETPKRTPFWLEDPLGLRGILIGWQFDVRRSVDPSDFSTGYAMIGPISCALHFTVFIRASLPPPPRRPQWDTCMQFAGSFDGHVWHLTGSQGSSCQMPPMMSPGPPSCSGAWILSITSSPMTLPAVGMWRSFRQRCSLHLPLCKLMGL